MIALVLGGARSGKSEVAEALAAAHGPGVLYVATAEIADEDFAVRVQAHRDRRVTSWTTVELDDAGLPALVAVHGAGPMLIDSLGTWVARTPDFAVDAGELVAALGTRTGPTIVVSEEVGLGVHPETEVGRRFRDALGAVNSIVAAAADDVRLVVAGRTLHLPAS